jgi:hypothetical protein
MLVLLAGCSAAAEQAAERRAPSRAQDPVAEGSAAKSLAEPTTQAVTNLKTQAAEISKAMLRRDHEKLADLTHPVVVDLAGGRAKFIKVVERMADGMAKDGLTFRDIRLSSPSKAVEAKGQLYAVFPYTLEMTGPRGEAASQPSYFICVSGDRGQKWSFLDGDGVRGDRARLKRFLPDLPDALALPAPQPLRVAPPGR